MYVVLSSSFLIISSPAPIRARVSIVTLTAMTKFLISASAIWLFSKNIWPSLIRPWVCPTCSVIHNLNFEEHIHFESISITLLSYSLKYLTCLFLLLYSLNGRVLMCFIIFNFEFIHWFHLCESFTNWIENTPFGEDLRTCLSHASGILQACYCFCVNV